MAHYLTGGSSDALLPLRAFTAPGGPLSFIGSKRNTKSRGSRSMPIGLREHAWNHMRITHLLRGRSYQRRSLPRGVDEYRCWLLQTQKRGPRHLLNNAKWKSEAPEPLPSGATTLKSAAPPLESGDYTLQSVNTQWRHHWVLTYPSLQIKSTN